MLKVGLTGNIGSGKTTVCKVFETLGVPVFYADDEAKKVLNSQVIINKLIEFLGEDVIDAAGKPDRAKIASKVFKDKQLLDKLNNTIHPVVIENYNIWLKANSHFPYTVKEAAILLESGYSKDIDKIIVVVSDEKTMIERVSKRDNVREEDVLNRLKNQMLQEEKVKMADFVINNSGNNMLIPQILNIHESLCKI
ncbi:MAG: dephospho-CoA kinase [Bacteroidetes bacterium]|nr:dephospho-CoA kinase [Bacteroidota bacterium]